MVASVSCHCLQLTDAASLSFAFHTVHMQLLVQLIEDELAALSQQEPDSAAAKSWAEILPFAEGHRDVVKRWGRFPHRNAMLGRQSTPEEESGLQDGSIPRW